MVKLDLHKRFIKGLAEFGLTKDDMKDYIYAGGNIGSNMNNSHFKQWKSLGFTAEDLPQAEDKCVCGHDILYNCYIVHKDIYFNRHEEDVEFSVLIIGSCCIKAFADHARICDVCRKAHKSHYGKPNICKDCRKEKDRKSKACVRCDRPRRNQNKTGLNMCNDCLVESKICLSCGKRLYSSYKTCFNCH